MAHTADDFVCILAPGKQLASGATTSAATAIPTMLNGQVPTKIVVTASAAACIRLGIAGVAATVNDTMVQPGDARKMRVPQGIINFAVIQVTTAGVVQVAPCEDA